MGASLRDRATRQSRSQSALSPPEASVPSAEIYAFSRDWEMLGSAARRLGFRRGNEIILLARRLKQMGFIECKMGPDCLRWRRTAAGNAAIGGEAL